MIVYLSPSASFMIDAAKGCHRMSASGCPCPCPMPLMLLLLSSASMRRYRLQMLVNSGVVIASRVHWSPKA